MNLQIDKNILQEKGGYLLNLYGTKHICIDTENNDF